MCFEDQPAHQLWLHDGFVDDMETEEGSRIREEPAQYCAEAQKAGQIVANLTAAYQRVTGRLERTAQDRQLGKAETTSQAAWCIAYGFRPKLVHAVLRTHSVQGGESAIIEEEYNRARIQFVVDIMKHQVAQGFLVAVDVSGADEVWANEGWTELVGTPNRTTPHGHMYE